MQKGSIEFTDDMLQEKCAVFGVVGAGAARLTYFGLYSLQHRGQEASGIAATDGEKIRVHKAMGLVSQVYTETDLEKLPGNMAIGHNRYSTSGGSTPEHNQPVARSAEILALAHNGNLPTTKKLQEFLTKKGIYAHDLNDSEMMHAVLKYYLVKGASLEEAIRKAFPLFTGAFSLVILTKDKLAAVRDANGIRPLSIGKLPDGYVISSETCAFHTVNAEYVRDVAPGELVVIDQKNTLTSYTLAKPNQKLDIFEFVYFSRPDSQLLGKSVYEVRKNLGIQLAREYPIQADVVIPVPDSAIPAAIGYAKESGIPFEFGLVKNRYIGRTFILPDTNLRNRGVQMKLHPLREVIEGKRVIIIDDSVVRGTTARKLVTMIRKAGAKEVHMMSSCPPVLFPDFYGIDTPTQQELIACTMPVEEITEHIGADSLSYLSYKGLIASTGLSEEVFCTSCFTGDYPIDIGENKSGLSYPKIALKHNEKSKRRAGPKTLRQDAPMLP
jgi:amidophosphoribosyltransferase